MPNNDRITESLGSIYHCFKYYDNLPADLITALKINLSHIAADSWEERFDWGGVYVNGKIAKNNQKLPCPCRIEYYEPKISIEYQKNQFPKFNSNWIIYEDDFLIICFKPYNLPSMISKEQIKINLYNYLKDYSNCDIHLPSRLDFSTAGLILISKNEKSHPLLQKMFESKKIKKTYILETPYLPEWDEFELISRIDKDLAHPILRKVVTTGGKEAITLFKKIRESKFIDCENNPIKTCLLEAQPKTGRTHQIRVHTAYLGKPIIGDNFYGGLASDCLHLVSHGIEFKHPLTNELISYTIPSSLLPYWLCNFGII